MSIIHLVPDDKFIDHFCEMCTTLLADKHVFYVVKDASALEYIKRGDLVNRITLDEFMSSKMVDLVNESKGFVVHSMNDKTLIFIDKLSRNVPIVWSGWGSDYYTKINNYHRMVLEDQTYEWYVNQYPEVFPKKRGFIKLLRGKVRKALDMYALSKPLSKINYFSAPLIGDFLVAKTLPGFRASYLQLNYGTVEDTYGLDNECHLGDSILVGNSATPTNNHIETFHMLKSAEVDREIIVPLSYGDDHYKKHIMLVGYDLFGDKFTPLSEFIPLADYDAILSRCGTAIMNHIRQQALGNINSLLCKGAMVYLNADGAAYRHYSDSGAHIFPLESLSEHVASGFDKLSKIQIEDNRDVVIRGWGRATVEANILNMDSILRGQL